jgi:hypothetical protein
MYVSNDAQLPFFAQIPQTNVARPLEYDNSLIERSWVQVIITDMRCDSPPTAGREKKRAAFAAPISAPSQVMHELAPRPYRHG